MPAVRAGQRPVLARNDPLNIFGRQRQQTLLIAAAHCCKEILHNLDILLNAHENFSNSSDRIVSDLLHRLRLATGLLKTKARIARKHGSWIAVAADLAEADNCVA